MSRATRQSRADQRPRPQRRPAGVPTGATFARDYDPAALAASNYLPIHAVLFRREAVARHGLRFDETLEHYEDWEFWQRLSQCGDFLHLPGVSASYRIHDSSGVHVHDVFFGPAYQRIYDKWRRTCPPAHFAAVMHNVWQGKLEQIHQQQRIADLDRLVADLDRQRAAAGEEAYRFLKDLERTMAERDALSLRASALDHELKAVHASLSWRCTAWLRQGRRLLRALKRAG